jgi:hypothetical protein
MNSAKSQESENKLNSGITLLSTFTNSIPHDKSNFSKR